MKVEHINNRDGQTLNHKIFFNHKHSGSDARFFSAHNTLVIISSAVGGNVHGKDEWVDLKSLEKFYHIVYKFIKTHA